MTKKFKFFPVIVAAVVVSILAPVLLSAGHAYAVETSVENLLLITTTIKTNDTGGHFTTSATPVFSTTIINCPAANCTIRVEVSSQFANINERNIVGAVVTVDGSQDGVLPGAVHGLVTTPFGASPVRTFSWMKTGLTTGQHTVDVDFFIAQGDADAGNRILTIQLYK
jgi:hypothetical protein